MRRRSLWFGLGGVLLIGVFITLAYILFPFYEEDIYRESLEAGFSAAMGRTVKLEGPISLTFSRQPTLVLEDFHVANPPWASQPHLFRADRLEIGLSLGQLLRRRLEVQKIALEGAELFLEEGSEGLDNWTFRKVSQPGILSRAVPSVFMTFAERGAITIEHSRIMYRPFPAEETTEVLIHRGDFIAPDDQHRKFSIEGTYQDSPVHIDVIGGRIMDLFTLTEPWPVDGVLSTTGASASIKGRIGGGNSDQMFDLQVQINGDRLSALNDLLQIALPDSAPFTIAAHVVKTTDGTSLNNVRGTLGASDIAGQLSLSNGEGRQKLTGQMTANTLQLNDFLVSAKDPLRGQEASPTPSSPGLPAVLPFDADLDVTVNQWLIGKRGLGSVSLSASVREDQVQISPVRIQSFGGTVNARLQVDLKTPQPYSTIEAKVTSLNYGQALRAAGVAMDINGSIDGEVQANWNGVTWQEFLSSFSVNFHTDHTTFGFSTVSPEAPLPLVLRQGSLRVFNGGPVTILAKGAYLEQAFAAKLLTGSPIDLTMAGMSWPVSLTAQAAGAILEAQGTFDTERPDFPGVFTISLKGRRLNELDPDLPPVGPYALRAHVKKEGGRYAVSDLRSRFGSSDVSGALELNLQKTPPHLTGNFNAKAIHVDELSSPGDIAIPSEVLRAIDIDMQMVMEQVQSEKFELAGLILTAALQSGRLKVESVQGTVLNQKTAYGNFHGEIVLDAARKIPSLSGHLALDHIRYERLFPAVRFVNLAENALDLEARFSSTGTTLFDMLTRATVMVKGEKLQVRFHRGEDPPAPAQLNSKLKVESVNGGPLRLHAEGVFQQTPFSLRAFTAPLGLLLEDRDLLPLNVALEVPHAKAEASGHLHRLHPAEEFTFKVFAMGENLGDWQFLSTGSLPDAGPLEVKGLLTGTPVGLHFTNVEGLLGESQWGGDVMFIRGGVRPRITGKLTAENMVMGSLKTPLPDDSAQKKRSMVGAMADSVKDFGAMAMHTLTDSLPGQKKPVVAKTRVIPDMAFPIEALRSFDLLLDGAVKHIRRGEEDLGHVAFQVTLDDGVLTMQPVTGNLWGGAFDGRIVLDGTQYVPTLDVSLNVQGLDYGRVTRTFGGTEFMKGQSQSITLMLKGRGDTLHEVLGRANGELNLVDGPLELATKYIDLWAADFLTTALSTAWKAEPVTKLNCMVGYFDIDEGEMKTDNILIDTNRLTVAGIGRLNLVDEAMDMVLTPRPKDPSLFNLAHMVRITGPLSNPDVSNDKLRIAESGGWGLLGLINPLGWAIAIPQIAGTTVGTMNRNPCVEAMKSRQHTAQAIEDIKGGLWGKIKKTLTNIGGFSESPLENSR